MKAHRPSPGEIRFVGVLAFLLLLVISKQYYRSPEDKLAVFWVGPTHNWLSIRKDERFHRQGLGRSLFRDAILRTWSVMKDGSAPVRFFAVDSKDEVAKAFYENLHMVPSPSDPMRLFLHYKDLRAIFDPEAHS